MHIVSHKSQFKDVAFNWLLLSVHWQISSAVSEVQEAVLQQDPRLAKAMIPVPTLHITLLVTHLANQEQVDLWVGAHADIHITHTEVHMNTMTPKLSEMTFASLTNYNYIVEYKCMSYFGHAIAH